MINIYSKSIFRILRDHVYQYGVNDYGFISVAGGAVRNLLIGEKVNDIDVYVSVNNLACTVGELTDKLDHLGVIYSYDGYENANEIVKVLKIFPHGENAVPIDIIFTEGSVFRYVKFCFSDYVSQMMYQPFSKKFLIRVQGIADILNKDIRIVKPCSTDRQWKLIQLFPGYTFSGAKDVNLTSAIDHIYQTFNTPRFQSDWVEITHEQIKALS